MQKKSFTLIELLVAIAIVGILSGFAFVQMSGAINSARDAEKKANLASINKALLMYKTINGAYPKETSSCTIGGTCTTLNTALAGSLPTIPSGQTYTYQSNSDGSDYAASTVLSTSYSYTYAPSTGYSTNTPVNGTCGSSNGANLSSKPSTNLCSDSSTPSVSGSGPWTWTCSGTYGGDPASCSTGGVPAAGVCGSSNGANLSSQPTTNLCSDSSTPSVSGSGPWTWTCSGINGGDPASCSTGGVPVVGSCGTASGSSYYTAPSSNLCNAGTASSVSGTGPWTWNCQGANTGGDASCSATLKVDGVCGSANKTYSSSSSSFGSDTFCVVGTESPSSHSFPLQGNSTSWTCSGQNSGITASCSALRNSPPSCPSGASCSSVSSDYVIQWPTAGSYSWTVPNGVTSVQYLIIGGGGGGGCAGAGGGAGGFLSGNLTVAAGGTVTIAVGSGGAGGAGGYDVAYRGTSGNNSSLAYSSTTLSAIGGGGGGSFNPSTYNGLSGGSGGGGQIERSGTAYGVGGSGTAGQGNAGGTTNSLTGGGGGGAGAVGGAGVGSIAGNGGVGLSSSITGTTTWYAGGGGGGSHNTQTAGTAGLGGGGNGSNSGGGGAATANTGGGGGGGGFADGGGRYNGGNGGSGIVIVRFLFP